MSKLDSFSLFICGGGPGSPSLETMHLQAMCEADQDAWETEEDLRIELELDPYEEITVTQEDAFWCEMYQQLTTDDN